MNVLLNLYPWYLPRRSRELRTHLDLMGLSAFYPDMEFSLARSIPAAVAGNAVWLAQYLLGRTSLDRHLMHCSYLYHSATIRNWLPHDLLRRLRPDVLFGHEYLPFNITQRDLPVVFETAAITEEMRHYRPRSSSLQINEHVRLNQRVKCRAISQATLVNIREPHGAEQFRKQFPELAHKVRTVPPFLQYISTAPRDSVLDKQTAPQRIKLLFVGNDAQRKGLPVLVAAIRGLCPQISSRLDVTIVSQFLDGPVDTEGIRARVISGGRLTLGEAMGPVPAVIKQGPLTVTEVLAEMASSHLFVMPTLADTFGFVYLEAMANGCAVIGPNAQPQSWILDNGRAGVLVNPASSEELAEAIKAMVVNNDRRKEIAIGGLRRFEAVFAPQVIAAQYRALFQEAIEIHRYGEAADGRLPKAG